MRYFSVIIVDFLVLNRTVNNVFRVPADGVRVCTVCGGACGADAAAARATRAGARALRQRERAARLQVTHLP